MWSPKTLAPIAVVGLLLASALAAPTLSAQDNRQCFPETGKCVQGAFLAYWRANGGLRQQGLPISDELQEQGADGVTRTVQYFERARFEHHPQNSPPNNVLLGLLGSEQFKAKYGQPASPAPLPPPGAGTRANPLPIGAVGAIRPNWQLKVVGVELNGNETVRKGNQFNDPPTPGRQFVIITIAATYSGPNSASLNGGHGLSVVGPAGVEYDSLNNDCEAAGLPNDLTSAEVFTNGTATGAICREVPIDEVGGLALYDSDTRTPARLFFSLKP